MCKLCNTKPVYEFTNKRKLCKNCFIHWFEKKFLYINRKFNLINRNDVVVIKGEGYKKAVLEHLLDKFKDKLMIKISNKRANKIASTSTIDETAQQIIQILINENNNRLSKLKPIDNKKIKPLYLFTDEEVLLYAKLKGLKLTPKSVPSSKKSQRDDSGEPKKDISEEGKEKKNKISEFINELEKKHPEVKRAVVNGYLELYNKS